MLQIEARPMFAQADRIMCKIALQFNAIRCAGNPIFNFGCGAQMTAPFHTAAAGKVWQE
jgi:hypothetical protein